MSGARETKDFSKTNNTYLTQYQLHWQDILPANSPDAKPVPELKALYFDWDEDNFGPYRDKEKLDFVAIASGDTAELIHWARHCYEDPEIGVALAIEAAKAGEPRPLTRLATKNCGDPLEGEHEPADFKPDPELALLALPILTKISLHTHLTVALNLARLYATLFCTVDAYQQSATLTKILRLCTMIIDRGKVFYAKRGFDENYLSYHAQQIIDHLAFRFIDAMNDFPELFYTHILYIHTKGPSHSSRSSWTGGIGVVAEMWNRFYALIAEAVQQKQCTNVIRFLMTKEWFKLDTPRICFLPNETHPMMTDENLKDVIKITGAGAHRTATFRKQKYRIRFADLWEHLTQQYIDDFDRQPLAQVLTRNKHNNDMFMWTVFSIRCVNKKALAVPFFDNCDYLIPEDLRLLIQQNKNNKPLASQYNPVFKPYPGTFFTRHLERKDDDQKQAKKDRSKCSIM